MTTGMNITDYLKTFEQMDKLLFAYGLDEANILSMTLHPWQPNLNGTIHIQGPWTPPAWAKASIRHRISYDSDRGMHILRRECVTEDGYMIAWYEDVSLEEVVR